MGLDINYYENIQEEEDLKYNDDNGEVVDSRTGKIVNEDYFRIFTNWLPERCEDIDPDIIYSFKEAGRFYAGSYSGYGDWRNWLAKIAGYEPKLKEKRPYAESAWEATEGPFWELIYFSDCEGVIGTKVSRKLYQDFLDFDIIAEEREQPLENYFYSKYKEWKEAFRVASNNGVVEFT